MHLRFLKTVTILLLLFLSVSLKANDFKQQAFSLYIQPSFNNTFTQFKSNVFSVAYKDSILLHTKGRTGLNTAINWSFQMRPKLRLQTGLVFQNMGFSVIKDHLRFLDTIHPKIGIMSDLSQTGPSYVDFKYRYFQLAMPVQFVQSIYNKKNTQLSWVYGGAVAIMYQHSIKAVLHGFSGRGNQKVYVFSNEAEFATRVNVQVETGLRVSSDLDNNGLQIYAQPHLCIPLFNANTSSVRHHLYQLGLQIGLIYPINKDKQS